MLYSLLLLAMHIPERVAATCYLLWSLLTKYKTCKETWTFRQIDVIVVFVTNREDGKFLTKLRQNDVTIRDQKRAFFFKCGATPIYLICCVRYEWPSCYKEHRWMTTDIIPLWHASLRHSAENITLTDGEPCMCTYVCEIFVCFQTYLFVRVRLAKTLKLRRHGRPRRTCRRGLSSIRVL